MKKILVPTDFSASATSALNYAIELAKRGNAEIILLHAYHVDYSTVYREKYESDAVKAEIDAKLHSQGIKIEHAGPVPYRIMSTENFAVDAILRAIEEEKIDMVVMGTKGASGLREALTGSNAARVMESAMCPVMIVPEGSTVKQIRSITYATDYRNTDLSALPELLNMAELFNAEIKFLHVASRENPEQKNLMDMFMSEVHRRTGYPNISSGVIYGSDIEKALEEYLSEGRTDLLVMSTHKRELMDRLFERSMTKKMVYHSHAPLLVLHYLKEEIYIT